MSRLIGFTIFTAFALVGCDGGSNTSVTTNRTTANSNSTMTNGNMMNNNTAVVVNNNMANNLANRVGMNSDNDFMMKAAQGGMAEVELSRLASTKAQNAELKKFAQMMITDHTKANTELKALAAKKNVTLPTELDAEHKAIMTKLQGLSGADFDKAYAEAMVDDHEKTVGMFEDAADGATDAELKAWAAKTLPTLKSHLEMIKAMEAKM